MRTAARRIWGLAVNAEHARLLPLFEREQGTDAIALDREAPALRDIMADEPGRSFASARGGRRSALAYGGDPLAERERRFVRAVAGLVERQHRAEGIDGLVLCAGADLLGRLRQELPEALQGLVVAEIHRNLLHLTDIELRQAMAAEAGGPGHGR